MNDYLLEDTRDPFCFYIHWVDGQRLMMYHYPFVFVNIMKYLGKVFWILIILY